MLIDPVIPSEAITTDVEDSFVVFEINELHIVRPVFPDGRVGISLFITEDRSEAEDVRDELIEHLGSWSEIAWKEFAEI